jgi:integrase
MADITISWLRAAHRGRDEKKSDGAPRGAGQLVARKRAGGIMFVYRFQPEPGAKRDDAVTLGPFDESGKQGLTLRQARERAGELAALYRAGNHDLKGYLARQRAAEEGARKEAEERAQAAAEAAQRGTLRNLLNAYIEHLERQGKPTARDARSIFNVHVFQAAPELAGRTAADIPAERFVELISRVVVKGKGRTAAKLRSGLRAAFELAARAKLDPAASDELRKFGVSMNPISAIPALSQFNKVRNRHLTATELGAFLRRVEKMPAGVKRDAIQLCLLLGGQRPKQLLRLQRRDVDLESGVVTLYDSKGKRSQPRLHAVPLVAAAAAILKTRLDALGQGEPVFSTDTEHAMRVETLGAAVAEIVDDMITGAPKEIEERFQLRDLRRTAETLLAGLKVSSDVRAQLQSHGLGGIQQRHYDRHDYMTEKRAALTKWARHLEKLKAGETAKVFSIEEARAS